MTPGKRLRRWLFLLHRWCGIASCLLFAMWFGSGLVMLYVSFPELTEAERLARLAPIDWAQVRLTPANAITAAGLGAPPRRLGLEMLGGAPVYRLLGWDGVPRTVSAATGRPMGPVDADTAVALVRAMPGALAPHLIGTLQHDQWSVPGRYDVDRPLHRVALGDAAGTELYVSSRTGAVVLDTTARERFWNWFGAVPHWLYLTSLRADQPVWRQVVLWVSGFCIVTAVTGFVVGVLRLSLRRRYRGRALSPYRGWALWHHLGGLLGGVFLLGWITSGWLSVDPGRLFVESPLPRAALERYADLESAGFAVDPLRLMSAGQNAIWAGFAGVGGRLVVTLRWLDSRQIVTGRDGEPLRLTADSVFAAAARLCPNNLLKMRTVLRTEDEQWYGHHSDPHALPVLRAGIGDPAGTWVHINPATGTILGTVSARRRLYRWLYAAPHRLDFGPLRGRPTWDLVMIALLLVGLAVSVSGIRIGWRRIRKSAGGIR